MSYEEARRNRKRQRRNENLSLILGLLSGVGRQFMQQRQMGQQREWTEQRDELKEQRELARMQKEQKFRSSESALNRENQLQIAQTYASRQQGGGDSQWLNEGMGTMSLYGEDPRAALTAIDERIKGLDPYEQSDEIDKLLRDRRAILPILGRERRGMQQPPPHDRTGDLNPTSTSAAPSGQQYHGQRQYAGLTSAIRGAYGRNDPAAWGMVQNFYPDLNIPQDMMAPPNPYQQGVYGAAPGLFQQTMPQ